MHYVGHDMALDTVNTMAVGDVVTLLERAFAAHADVSLIRAGEDGRITVVVVDEDDKETALHFSTEGLN